MRKHINIFNKKKYEHVIIILIIIFTVYSFAKSKSQKYEINLNNKICKNNYSEHVDNNDVVEINKYNKIEGNIIEKTDMYIRMIYKNYPKSYYIKELYRINGKDPVFFPNTKTTTSSTEEILNLKCIKINLPKDRKLASHSYENCVDRTIRLSDDYGPVIVSPDSLKILFLMKKIIKYEDLEKDIKKELLYKFYLYDVKNKSLEKLDLKNGALLSRKWGKYARKPSFNIDSAIKKLSNNAAHENPELRGGFWYSSSWVHKYTLFSPDGTKAIFRKRIERKLFKSFHELIKTPNRFNVGICGVNETVSKCLFKNTRQIPFRCTWAHDSSFVHLNLRNKHYVVIFR